MSMSTCFPDRCMPVVRHLSAAALRTFAPLLAAVLSMVTAGDLAAADPPTEPYVVFVAEEEAYARCGPDGEYYRTDPLRLGQELEVHVETDEGWLGIRPPENSFSWIPAATVQRIEGTETARVVDQHAVAWIGTSLGRARKYRWQVQLSEGEEVVIVGQSDRETASGTERWYRIVPPSGEFRWVHRSQIADSAEELVQRSNVRRRPEGDVPPSLAAAEPRHRADGGLQETLRGIAEAFNVSGEPVGSGLAPAAQASNTGTDLPGTNQATSASVTIGSGVVLRDIAAASSAPPVGAPPTIAVASEQALASEQAIASEQALAAGESWTSGVRPAAATLAEASPAATAGSGAPLARERSSGAGLTPTAPPVLQQIDHEDPVSVRELAARVATADISQLQLELSRQMAAGATAAMVQPIRQRAAEWIQQATEPVDRGRARLLLERAEQYQRVARRRNGQSDVLPALDVDQAATVVAPVVPSASPTAATQASANAADDAESAAASEAFDRSGYLVQVYSARPDSPPFALTDPSGKTLAYVSPAPGLNLRRYLNTQVGVYGQVGYHTGLDTPHLIAQRAVQIGR